MVAYAQRARQEGTRAHWEQPNALYVCQARIQQSSGPQSHQHAFIVLQAPARLQGAQSALVMWAIRGLMVAYAQRAIQEGTRAHWEQTSACHVSQARIQQGLQSHATSVGHTPALLKGAQSALAMRTTRGLMVARA